MIFCFSFQSPSVNLSERELASKRHGRQSLNLIAQTTLAVMNVVRRLSSAVFGCKEAVL